jgi:ABC-type branched-subunit amino acid transport system ATPase component
MTVEENIRIGALVAASISKQTASRRATLFPILRERRQQMESALSGGQQKMLGLARAGAQPKLLMVDGQAKD